MSQNLIANSIFPHLYANNRIFINKVLILFEKLFERQDEIIL